MHVLRNIYEFVTGGSIASPVIVIAGIGAASCAPVHLRGAILAAAAALALIAATFEREA